MDVRRVIGAVALLMVCSAVVGCGSSDDQLNAATERGWQPTAALTGADGQTLGDAMTIWTGTEVVLVGGFVDRATGIVGGSPAFDPATDQWRTIAAPPVPFVRDVRPSRAVWTDHEILWFGNTTPPADQPQTEGYRPGDLVGAAYDPANDSWRVLASPPPAFEHFEAAVWTGARLLVWSRGIGVAMFDPEANTWVPVADSVGPPLSVGDAPTVWDGSRLVVFASYSGDVAAYDPTTNQWTSWPAAPSAVTAAVWTGSELLTFDAGSGAVATFDEKGQTWSSGTSGPFDARVVGATAWTGRQFAAWGGIQFDYTPTSNQPASAASGATYDVQNDTWTDLPPLAAQDVPGGSGTWIGDALFNWSVAQLDDGRLELRGATLPN